MVNVAQVVLPAASVTRSVYVPFPVISVQLAYAFPLSVAVTHGLLSENVMLTHVV
jgi:hypothetical protein